MDWVSNYKARHVWPPHRTAWDTEPTITIRDIVQRIEALEETYREAITQRDNMVSAYEDAVERAEELAAQLESANFANDALMSNYSFQYQRCKELEAENAKLQGLVDRLTDAANDAARITLQHMKDSAREQHERERAHQILDDTLVAYNDLKERYQNLVSALERGGTMCILIDDAGNRTVLIEH